MGLGDKHKIFIKNRSGLDLCVVVNRNNNADKGIVFIEHGLTSSKDRPHIQLIADTFFEKGYTTIIFDATCAMGESGGSVENITFTSHYNDLEDVIEWAKEQNWYKEPFALSGHSLGGFATSLYSQNYPDQVSLLIPVSPATSGKNLAYSSKERDPKAFIAWKKEGYYKNETSVGEALVPYSFQEDIYNYSLFDKVKNTKCRTVIITGDKDDVTILPHVKEFYNALDCNKDLIILKDCPHRIYEEDTLEKLKQALLSVL